MKILHLLSGGGLGGIEILCRDIAHNSKQENEFVFLFSGGKITDELEREGQHIYRLYLKKGRIRRIGYLMRLVRIQQYDVIIAHHGTLSIFLYYLFLQAVFPEKIYIKYLHSVFDERFYYKNNWFHDRLICWSLNRIFRVSDHIVAVSEYVKVSFAKRFPCNSERIAVIYNGIPIKKYNLLKQQERGHGRTLLYIGRLEKEKGLAILLKAAEIMEKDGLYSFRIIIVGSGSYTEVLERVIAEERLEERVILEKETLDKDKYYGLADIFLYPSVCREAFGISIVEAMQQGLLCVASDTGGIPELINHQTNGFLFRTGNARSLVNCLYGIFNMDQETKNAVCMQAAVTAQGFSIENTIEQLEKLYEKWGEVSE